MADPKEPHLLSLKVRPAQLLDQVPLPGLLRTRRDAVPCRARVA